jgi:hypothetical protein
MSLAGCVLRYRKVLKIRYTLSFITNIISFFIVVIVVLVNILYRCKSDHFLPTSTEEKNERSYIFTPPYAFIDCTRIKLSLLYRCEILSFCKGKSHKREGDGGCSRQLY